MAQHHIWTKHVTEHAEVARQKVNKCHTHYRAPCIALAHCCTTVERQLKVTKQDHMMSHKHTEHQMRNCKVQTHTPYNKLLAYTGSVGQIWKEMEQYHVRILYNSCKQLYDHGHDCGLASMGLIQ